MWKRVNFCAWKNTFMFQFQIPYFLNAFFKNTRTLEIPEKFRI